MKVVIETIPHQLQRYNTPGDWFFDEDEVLHIKISELGNKEYEHCIAMHEYFEAITCTENGITEKSISDFDKNFEEERSKGLHEKDAEPGMESNAPYRIQHQMATGIELILGSALFINWKDYEKKVTDLIETYEIR